MDRILKKIKSRLETEGIADEADVKFTDFRVDQNKTVYIAELKCGPLYVRIIPQCDYNKMFSLEVYTHGAERTKVTDIGEDYLVDSIIYFAREAYRPSYKDKAHGKALEHYDRIDADENELSEEKLDALIKKLELGMYNGEMKEPDTDEMTDSPESNKNVVKTFPTDSKLELSSMPHKVYNKGGGELPKNVPKDGIVKCKGADTEDLPTKAEDEEDLWEKERDADGVPQRLNESLKGKILCYTKELGAIFVDKKLYEQYKQEKGTKFGIGERGEVILMKEGQTNNNKFVPINLRRL